MRVLIWSEQYRNSGNGEVARPTRYGPEGRLMGSGKSQSGARLVKGLHGASKSPRRGRGGVGGEGEGEEGGGGGGRGREGRGGGKEKERKRGGGRVGGGGMEGRAGQEMYRGC